MPLTASILKFLCKCSYLMSYSRIAVNKLELQIISTLACSILTGNNLSLVIIYIKSQSCCDIKLTNSLML